MDKISAKRELGTILLSLGLFDSNECVQRQLLQSLDSLQFIQLVVAIESHFMIGIPDQFLSMERFQDLDGIVDVLCAIMDGDGDDSNIST